MVVKLVKLVFGQQLFGAMPVGHGLGDATGKLG